MSQSSCAPILAYETSLNLAGVSIDRRAESLRIIIPRAGRWRELPVGYKIGIVALGFYLLLILVVGLSMNRKQDRIGFVVTVSEMTATLLIVLAFAWRRVHMRLVLELDGASFCVTRVLPFFGRYTRAYPRSALTGANLNPYDGTLAVHLHGYDLLELRISRDRAVVKRVAEAIMHAHAELPIASDPAKADGTDGQDLQPLPHSRRGALAISLVMLGSGAVLLLLGFPFVVFGAVLILAAGLPIGIAYGTQEKDFWV